MTETVLAPRSLRGVLILLLAALYPWHIALWATSYTGKDPVIPHGGLNVSLGDSVIAIVGVTLLLQAAVGRLRLPRYTLHASLWLLAAAISTTVNALAPGVYFALRDSLMGLVKIGAAMMWMIAVFWLLQDNLPKRILQLVGLSVIAGVGFAIEAIIENVFFGVQRSFGPFQNANIFGNYLVLNLFFAIALDRFLGGPAGLAFRPTVRAGIRGALRYGAVTLLLLGLLASGSRGAIAGFVAGLIPAVPWARISHISLRGIVTAVLGIIVLTAALDWYLAQNPFVVSRFTQTAEGRGPNVEERFELWQAAEQAFSQNPVVGLGYTQFPNYAGLEPDLRATVTHQTYLATAAELGVVGLVTLGWLLISVIRDSWRVRDKFYLGFAHGCCGFVVAACTQGLFNNVQQERSLWITFGIVAAVIAQIQYASHRELALQRGGRRRRPWRVSQ